MAFRLLTFLLCCFFAGDSHGFIGYGMYGGMGMCPGGMLPGAGANDIQDEIDDLRSDIRSARSELRSVSRAATAAAQKAGEYEDILSTIKMGDIAAKHMRTKKGCLKAYTTKTKKAKCKGKDCGKTAVPDKQYKAWLKVCISLGKVRVDICATSPHPRCREAVANYKATNHRLVALQDREEELKLEIKDKKEELRDLRRDRSRASQQNQGLEAYCPQCMLMGNSMMSGMGGGNSHLVSQLMMLHMLSQTASNTSQFNPFVASQNPMYGYASAGANFGYPFAQMGQYGALAGGAGMNGFLCGMGLGAMGPLFGGMGPYGQPQAGGGNQYGGAYGGVPASQPGPRYQPPSNGVPFQPGYPPPGPAGPWGVTDPPDGFPTDLRGVPVGQPASSFPFIKQPVSR